MRRSAASSPQASRCVTPKGSPMPSSPVREPGPRRSSNAPVKSRGVLLVGNSSNPFRFAMFRRRFLVPRPAGAVVPAQFQAFDPSDFDPAASCRERLPGMGAAARSHRSAARQDTAPAPRLTARLCLFGEPAQWGGAGKAECLAPGRWRERPMLRSRHVLPAPAWRRGIRGRGEDVSTISVV